MIDPHWDVTDLDPVTWRAIGKYIRPTRYVRAGSEEEHALFVLHDQGMVLNVVDNRLGRRTDIEIDRVRDPKKVAELLHGQGEWDRVHVIDKAHLEAVSTEVQSNPQHDLTLDAYYRFVYQQYWDGEGGYVTSPARAETWNGWTWSGVQAWVKTLPDPAVLGLGVVGKAGLEIGILLVVSDGSVRKVTTFEALPVPRESADVTQDYFDRIWTATREVIGPPRALMLCTPDVFEAWLTGSEKQQTIDSAIAQGIAIIRIAE